MHELPSSIIEFGNHALVQLDKWLVDRIQQGIAHRLGCARCLMLDEVEDVSTCFIGTSGSNAMTEASLIASSPSLRKSKGTLSGDLTQLSGSISEMRCRALVRFDIGSDKVLFPRLEFRNALEEQELVQIGRLGEFRVNPEIVLDGVNGVLEGLPEASNDLEGSPLPPRLPYSALPAA
jgi:hypothetical protein